MRSLGRVVRNNPSISFFLPASSNNILDQCRSDFGLQKTWRGMILKLVNVQCFVSVGPNLIVQIRLNLQKNFPIYSHFVSMRCLLELSSIYLKQLLPLLTM